MPRPWQTAVVREVLFLTSGAIQYLPMMADFPAAYRGQPDLPFLVRIPSTWEETRALQAEFGKCLVIARRNGNDWYLGAMTAAEPRSIDLPLAFLGPGQFHAQIWTDDAAAGPTVVVRRDRTVSADDSIHLDIPPNGGAAIRLTPSAE